MSKRHSNATRNATTPFLYEVAYTTSKQENGGADHAIMNEKYEDDRESVTICNNYRSSVRHGIQEVVGSIPSISTKKREQYRPVRDSSSWPLLFPQEFLRYSRGTVALGKLAQCWRYGITVQKRTGICSNSKPHAILREANNHACADTA